MALSFSPPVFLYLNFEDYMKEYNKLPVGDIIVEREKRQRKQVGLVQDLADSIKKIGLINPITITRDNVLVAGERRLEACKLLSPTFQISVRYLDELSNLELQIVELDENLKRSELNWQDQVQAVRNLHNLLCAVNENWTVENTADYIGMSRPNVTRYLSIASNLSNEKVAKADSLSTANSIIQRETQRAVDNEMNYLSEALAPMTAVEPETKVLAKILQGDFSKISKEPMKKYNFIHCDFPYGIDHHDSEQGNIDKGSFEGYADGEEVYWRLCGDLLGNINNIALPSCHIMFWFSMKFYSETIEYFHDNSDFKLVDPRPLIWMKSDNKGIVSDVTRRPRNIYETALLFSRGDRRIITPVSNAYACPSVKSFHPSEKPEPMLKHFFRMFVDEYCEMLDPTCGSGTSVRAAFELGAKRSIGYELNEEFAKSADSALNRVKGLKQLERENHAKD